MSDLITHYKKKLSELKEVQQKQEKSTDNKSSEYSSNTSETSESDDSSYQSQEGSKKEEENINNEIENKKVTLKPVLTKKKTLKDSKEVTNDISSPKNSIGRNSQHKYSL